MKVLITGATGLIGSNLLRLVPKGIDLYATYNINRLVPAIDCKYYHMDITNYPEVEIILKEIQPDVVIHAAAKATPDWCEKHPQEAYEVNVVGSKNIIDVCGKIGADLFFFSSNAIFDGTEAPYKETSRANPKDEYGRNKWAIENYLRTCNVPYTIARSMCVYGWNNPYERKNFTSLLIDRCMRGEPMQVTQDITCNFIYVEDLCRMVWNLVIKGFDNETYNLAGDEALTHWLLTQQAIKCFNLNPELLTPVNMDNLTGYIKRPKDTRFDCAKAIHEGFSPLPVNYGLEEMKMKCSFDWKWI